MKQKKKWYDYLWIWSIVYFSLGFFNILFAWLGMLDFMIPVVIAIFGANKWFCNHACGRGQLFRLLGNKTKFFGNRPAPRWMASKGFRIGFMIFFFIMFGNLLYQTYLVAGGAEDLKQALKLFWTFRIPWGWTYTAGLAPDWVYQFSYGFYSLMLTSTIIGLVVMVLYRPRTWCSFCPMGTFTQCICKVRK